MSAPERKADWQPRVDPPSRDEITEFLSVFHRLSRFESETRLLRGYGAFKSEELPIPAAVQVIAWLEQTAGLPDADDVE